MTEAPNVSRHRGWLNDRNAISRIVETASDDALSTFQRDALCGGINALERQIFDTPPDTGDELLAVMVLALQTTAEGNELSMELAAKIVRQAMDIELLGSLACAWPEIREKFAEGGAA